MKQIIALFGLLTILIPGCHSTYTLEQYISKEKFYDDFNNSVGNKSTNITLLNDSLLTDMDGAQISRDSLFFISQTIREERFLFRSQVLSLKYFENSEGESLTNLLLHTGEVIQAESITYKSDSTIRLTAIKITKEKLALTQVKKISFYSHWRGVPGGMVIGAAIGALGGSIYYNQDSKGRTSQNEAPFYPAGTTPLGLMAGCVVGWVIGYNQTYEFNP